MKKLTHFLAVTLIFGLFACSGKDTSSTTKETSSDTTQKTEMAKPTVADVQFHAFKHSGLDFDDDGWCVNGTITDKEKITEVKATDPAKPILCRKGEYIQKLVISGQGEGITLVFFDKKGKEIHKKENFRLDKEISFSAINYASDGSGSYQKKKRADYADWFESAAKVSVLQNGQPIKELSWKNNDWLRQ
ncbi:MAG: hypothetical protein FJX92_08815 [Bacteroidetes bacterium]|nr:hypothetical protein [Bacteroidota bacterium]